GRSFLIDTILVDNDSADNSVALVRDAFPNVKVICAGENLGFARANNLAFEQIQSEFVLLLNPDAVLADDAVAKMLDVALADSRIGIVGCKILNPDGTTEELGIQSFPIPLTEFISMLFGRFRTCEVLRSVLPYHDPQKDGEDVKLYGACLLLRREALMEAEGFDDQFFMYCEDVDLCFRLQALGWKVFYLSTAEAVHLKGRSSSIRGVEFKTRTMFESLLKLVEKHRGSRAVWPYKVALAVAALA